MTRNTRSLTTLAALTAAVVTLIAPAAIAGHKAPNKRTITKQSAAATRAKANKHPRAKQAHRAKAPKARRSAQRHDAHYNASARSHYRGRDYKPVHKPAYNHRDRRDRTDKRDRYRAHDRGYKYSSNTASCSTYEYRRPVYRHDYRPATLGTFTINGECVEVRKGRVFDTLLDAARCAGYDARKVKLNGRTYIRIYGCPEVCFEGYGYTMDVVRYHNNIIDIAIFEEYCAY